MITYQDLLAVGENVQDRMDFVKKVVNSHKSSEMYKTAVTADLYDRRKNETISNYRKMLYTISGKAVEDSYSANYKLCSGFFQRLVLQQNQFLLGNGISWSNEDTVDKLGNNFDTQVQTAGHYALVDGVSFGFWNLDHLEVFRLTEFAPLWDEEDGALKAGVRFWQIDSSKPLRATLYEMDGYTDYVWKNGEGSVLHEKRKYILKIRTTAIDGEEIYDGENYPSFPIVPLWANEHKQSELTGIRESIDAYDLIKSGFANDIDDASLIYWTIQNAGGMDDVDLVNFVQHMKTIKAAVVDDDGAKAESHSIEVPYASREALLDRLREDIYEYYMGLDIKSISSGAATATEIKAAYEPMNSKADQYEYQVLSFLDGIMYLSGVDDNPSFTRSMIVNTQESIQILIQAAAYLPEDYVTKKILELLGDSDKTEDILAEMQSDEFRRMTEDGEGEPGPEGDRQATEETGIINQEGV